MENPSLEAAVNKEYVPKEPREQPSKKPSKFKKILKRAGVAAGIAAVAAGIAGYQFLFGKEGQTIRGNLDGRIDREYYHNLALNNTPVTNINQIDDLVAEVYNLTSGRKIEDDFKFSFFDESNKTWRIKICEKLGGNLNDGLNRGNGDVYSRQGLTLPDCLEILFHEIGHGPNTFLKEFRERKLFSGKSSEPKAEENVINSIVSLMYIDPELGYAAYDNYLNIFRMVRVDPSTDEIIEKAFFRPTDNEWIAKKQLNILRCIKKGDLEIKEYYDSAKEISDAVQEKIKGKSYNQLVSEMHEGILELFKQRFKDKADFQEKYKKLEKSIRYGGPANIYDTDQKEFIHRIESQEKVLEEEPWGLIKAGIQRSIIEECAERCPERAYSIVNKIIEDAARNDRIEIVPLDFFSFGLKYASKSNDKNRTRELISLVKRIPKNKNSDNIDALIKRYETN